MAKMSGKGAIDLWLESCAVDGGTEHRVILENLPATLPAPRREVYWRAEHVPNLPLPPVMDSYVAGMALVAARAGADLNVHGPMSRVGLYNVMELVAARNAQLPGRFPWACQVKPERIVEIQRPGGEEERALAAFSGGVDSSFTVLRHARGLEGAAWKLDAAVMVHGFDARTEQKEQFGRMRARAGATMARAGIPLHTVVTNVKEQLNGAGWPQTATALTANALAMFSNRCAVGIVSAGVPYHAARMSATHPAVFDAMASNEWFRVVTDGGELLRADKIEALREFPEVIDALKVCWEGPDAGRNCGVCEKCVLTRLDLLAAGVKEPGCFEDPLTVEMIQRLRWRSTEAARHFFHFAWVELEERGVSGPIVDALRGRLIRTWPKPNLYDLRDWLRGPVKARVKGWVPRSMKRGIKRVTGQGRIWSRRAVRGK